MTATVITGGRSDTATCPVCGGTVGTYNSGSLNRMRTAPIRFCAHRLDDKETVCTGSYGRVEKSKPATS